MQLKKLTATQIHLINAIVYDNARHVRGIWPQGGGTIALDFELYKRVQTGDNDKTIDAFNLICADEIQWGKRSKKRKTHIDRYQTEWLAGFCRARFNCDCGFVWGNF